MPLLISICGAVILLRVFSFRLQRARYHTWLSLGRLLGHNTGKAEKRENQGETRSLPLGDVLFLFLGFAFGLGLAFAFDELVLDRREPVA